LRFVAGFRMAKDSDTPGALFAEETDEPRGERTLARAPDAEASYYIQARILERLPGLEAKAVVEPVCGMVTGGKACEREAR